MRLLPKLPNLRQYTFGDLAKGGTVAKMARVFGYADFRYFWLGAFVSFSGSWIQRIAEGYFVFQITGDESKLAFVSFCSSIPVFFLGFIAGSLSDRFDKRRTLILTQLLFALGALYLAYATWQGFVTYAQIVIVALLLGLVSTIEMPTRQSVLSRVVPVQDLPTAIPITAMTFNGARIIGPAIGGWILAQSKSVALCYFINGLSFLALIYTAIAIKADLSARQTEKAPIGDVLLGGLVFAFKDARLRTLFLLESVTGVFGLFYISLLPAITGDQLGLARVSESAAKKGLGIATTCIGVGAIVGLVVITILSDTPRRGLLIKLSMTSLGLSLCLLGLTKSAPIAYLLFFVTGMSTIIQFNTTNALFQLLSTEKNRGRVLAMHIWALNGLSPFGILLFGWIASASHKWQHTNFRETNLFVLPTNTGGAALAVLIGGITMLIGATASWLSHRGLSNLSPDLEPNWTGEVQPA